MTSPREGTASLIAAVLEPMAVRLEFLGEVTDAERPRAFKNSRLSCSAITCFFSGSWTLMSMAAYSNINAVQST